MSDQKELLIYEVLRMKKQGYSNVAIANRLGLHESEVRSLLKESPWKTMTALLKQEKP